MSNPARLRVLAVVPGLFPSTIIGVGRPLMRLHRAGEIELILTLESLVRRRWVESADVLVMCRTVDSPVGQILDWAGAAAVPLIYELDDNLLELPRGLAGVDYEREAARRARLIGCLQQAALVRTYSPFLQQVLRQYNRNVRLVSGPLEWKMIPEPLPPRDAGQVRVVYATSRQQDGMGQMLVRPLLRVLEMYPQVRLTIWGTRLADLAGHPRVRHLRFVRDYERFFVRFARERFDIGLAPLVDEPFYRCKSNNKFREYAACGIAGVYSDMPVYETSVADGVTGLLAANDEQAWFRAIDRLVRDEAMRERIQRDAGAVARTEYNEARTDTEWMSHLRELDGRIARGASSGTSGVEVHSSRSAAAPSVAVRALTDTAPTTSWRRRLRDTLRGASRQLVDIGTIASWEFHRWRLGQRMSSLK